MTAAEAGAGGPRAGTRPAAEARPATRTGNAARPGARIEAAIRAARDRGRPALAAFVTAGFPDREGFGDVLRAVGGAADVLEVGVPFSDPMADGVTIQRASRAALAAGVTLPWILAEVDRARPAAPVLLMSYLNPLLAFGMERLGPALAEAGVAGLIVPDLPYEESAEIADALEPAGAGLVQLVTPVTPPERARRLCEASRGFVYAVTRTGITGGGSDVEGVAGFLDGLRAVSPVPVLAGFGIRDAAQVRRIAPHADGVIVGSALVERLERGEDPAAFLRGLMTEGGRE
ncbi:MAG: tryptophan synthase subunit alpha [Gemmatimonadota bacterium]|nr:tryptophan synthase subunit alpha [Gemmatimonadota bacterium]